MATAELAVFCAIAGIIIGVVIGYYKARAEGSDQYIKKEDCIRCGEEKKERAAIVDERIERGTELFSEIKTDIALIMQKLNAMGKNKMAEK